MVRQRILSATTFIWAIFLSFASLKEKGAIFCCLPEEAHYRITHYRPGKTVRFSISVLQTKGLAGLYSNPKYQAVWFVLCKMRSKTLILSLFQALKTAKNELFMQYFDIISATLASFELGDVSNDRALFRLQNYDI